MTLTPETKNPRTLPVVVWVGAAALVAYIVIALGFYGDTHLGTLLLALVLVVGIFTIAQAVAIDADRRWLPVTVLLAFGLKLAAAGARYWVLVAVYGGRGDAKGYHSRGRATADIWRSFEVPELSVGGEGTTFLSEFTGLLYVPYKPTMLGGFFLYATLAFLGQLLLYLAFRRAVPTLRLRWYALAVLLMPSMLYWPASIGKESLILFFIGVSCFGAANLMVRYEMKYWGLIGAGLVGIAAIRPHISALLAAGIGAAILFGHPPQVQGRQFKRMVMIMMGTAAAVWFVVQLGSEFGLEALSLDELDPFIEGLQDRTQTGGSAVEGSPATSIGAFPEAFLRVVYRPLPHEAHNPQAAVASIEGAVFLALTIWRAPRMISNLRYMRRQPYLIFCAVYTLGFVVAFSTFLNLGIIARQRIQMLPFFLALIVVLGWGSADPREVPDSSDESETATPIGESV